MDGTNTPGREEAMNPEPLRADKARRMPLGCMGCDKVLRNPNHTLCAACAEDAGYGRRAR